MKRSVLLLFTLLFSVVAFGQFATTTGTGTANYIAKWTSTTNLSVSALCQSVTGGNIGIGTCAPTQKLQINGGNFVVKGVNNFGVNGNTATAYIGDTNHPITATYGQGVSFGVYKFPKALSIADTTGTISVNGTAVIDNTGHYIGPGAPSGGGTVAYFAQATSGSFASSQQTIVSLLLPAGIYLLNGKVTAGASNGDYDYAYCTLVSTNNTYDVSTHYVSEYTYYYTLPVQGIATLTGNTTVKLQCYDNNGATVQFASLSAIPLATVNTQAVTKAAAVRK